MPRHNRPPAHLPAPVRDHPAVITACRDRDLGRLFRTINNLTDYPEKFTASHIARRCEMTQSQVGEYMTDQRHATSLAIYHRVTDGLHIPATRFGLTPRPWERDARTSPLPAPIATRVPDRQSFASPAHQIQSWQLMDTLTQSNISHETLSQIEHAVYSSASRYPSAPPAELLPVVLGQIARLQGALANSQSLRTLRSCVRLLGVLAGLAGNLYVDLGDPTEAAAYFQIGRVAGREAEDDALTAWVMTTESIGPFFSERHRQATELLEHAARLVNATGNRRRQAWIEAMTARAYAAVGDRARALDALERSVSSLSSADGPTEIDFFDAARLDGISGTCHLHLGDTGTSARMLQAAINGRAAHDAKGRALLILDLAKCRIVEGEITEACDLVGSALDLASDSIVQPIADRARIIHDDLSPWHQLGSVTDLAERVRGIPAALPAQRG